MPRTKHLVIVLGALILIAVCWFVFLTFTHTRSAFLFVPPQSALAIEAGTLGKTPGVRVAEDGERELVRNTLVAALRDKLPTNVPSQQFPTISAPTPGAQEDEKKDAQFTQCPSYTDTSTSWGAVNVTRSEGARVIASLIKSEEGGSRHVLELPDMPQLSGTEPCHTDGMVGIALDGRLMYGEVPFVHASEGLQGYARDGFGIYGNMENGEEVTSSHLDACNGHVHAIVWNGIPVSLYHYHVISEAPYTPSCLRGAQVAS